jgi:cytochrome c553
MPSVADDAVAGKAAYEACAACHGESGEGNRTLNAPRLTHLEPVYLQAQLQKFRSGVRGGAGASAPAVQMAGMAATLTSDQAVSDVVAFIGALESSPSPVTVEGDVELGGDYYNQFCGACHGAEAEGNAALNSPRLVGSDDWYLMAQLRDFRSGTRGAHPDDRTGKQMRAMASVLPGESAMADVVAFIRSLAR